MVLSKDSNLFLLAVKLPPLGCSELGCTPRLFILDSSEMFVLLRKFKRAQFQPWDHHAPCFMTQTFTTAVC